MGEIQEIYFEDDTFEVSEEVKNMSHEERMKRIHLYEEMGRREAESIPDTKPLLAVR